MYKRKNNKLSIFNIILVSLSIIICTIYLVIYLACEDYYLALCSAAVILITPLIYFIDKIVKYKIPVIIKSFYEVYLFFTATLGGVVGLFVIIPFYDKVTHFISGLLIALLFIIYGSKLYRKYSPKLVALSAICFTATTAVFWEIFEFTIDIFFHRHNQRGNTDTMTDMIVAIIGSIIIALIYVREHKRNELKQ